MASCGVADIINLRQQRKAKARALADAAASENSIRHGRTKAERERDRLQAEQDRRRLDALRRGEPGE